MSPLRLQALVLCSDEKILRVLRRVLSDLEIVIDHCAESDAAIHKLTRQRYEAIIVDCANGQPHRKCCAAPAPRLAINELSPSQFSIQKKLPMAPSIWARISRFTSPLLMSAPRPVSVQLGPYET